VTRILVWQWGKRGGAPRFAARLAEGLRAVTDTEVVLSLSSQAELLRGPAPPHCDLPMNTYASTFGFACRLLSAAFAIPALARRVRALHPDVAICAQPGPLDLLMAAALRRLGLKFVVLVHDADLHPGDGLPLQMTLQTLLCRQAAGVVALTDHVAARLRQQGLAGTAGRPLFLSSHPPVGFDPPPPPPLAHGGPIRLLSFGRLLPYKGLDLLAETLRLLGPRADVVVRVVGQGPDTPALDALRALPGVTVENRWVPEDEVGALLGWADALILAYTEASQSGVAAAALAAGRRVVATRVGGLIEQLQEQPLATLCPPDAAALATALEEMIAAPMTPSRPVDASSAWRAMARALLTWITATVLKPVAHTPAG
jgi:glycosyltransferase involved in cell wall biosynthesis